MKPRSRELSGESEWSQRQRCDMDEARRVRSPRRPNQSSQYNELALSSRTLWRVVVCPRRESNPHLRFRKPLFFPLNYGDHEIYDCRLAICDFKTHFQARSSDRIIKPIWKVL